MAGVLIIVIVVLIIINNNSSNKIKELEKQLEDYPKFCGKCGNKLKPDAVTIKEEIVSDETENYIEKKKVIAEPIKPVKIEVQHTDTEIKNSLILIIGSCLLVLAAILFLATTWTVTSNYIKTFVLILMLIIFNGASKIADKYLKIKQTAKAFYYIALAYIPIVFVSVFVLKLLGVYFSFYGEGRYVYLFFSSIIVAVIYYIESKKNKSKVTSFASMILSYLGTVFYVCIFNTNHLNIICALIIYTFILSLLYYRGKYYLDEEVHRVLIIACTILVTILNLEKNISFIHYLNIAMNFVNIYFLLNEIYKKERVFEYIYPAYIMFFFINLSFYFNDLLVTQVLLIISFIVIYLINYIKYNAVKESSYLEILICSLYLISTSIINHSSTTPMIPYYLIMAFVSLLSYLYYYSSKKDYSAWLSNILLVLSVFSLFVEYSYSFSYIGVIYLGLLVLSKYAIKDDTMKMAAYNVSYYTFIVSSILMFADLTFVSILSYVLFIIFNFVEYNDQNKDRYKVGAYLFADIAVLSTIELYGNLTMTNAAIAISCITLVLALIELYISKLNNKTNNYYIISHAVLSFILLNNIDSSLLSLVTLIVLSASFIMYVNVNKLNKGLCYVPVIGLIPTIYFKEIEGIALDLTYYVSIIMLLLFTFLIYLKKDKRYIIYFFIYVACHILFMDESKYLSLALVSLGTYTSYYVTTDKYKDIFKVMLSVEALLLVKFIISDLNIDNILLRFVPYFIWLIYVSRFIIKNHISDYKALEYVGSIILNLIVLYDYTNESEGIMFITFLIILVVITYLLKYGPYFIVSLIFILINFFSLTSEFWLSLSWWIYALSAGLILIGFGIVNEMNENKINKKELIKSLKDKLDL